jgi:hypothetical protein
MSRRPDYEYSVGGRVPLVGDYVTVQGEGRRQWQVVEHSFAHSTGRCKLRRAGSSKSTGTRWEASYRLVLVQGVDDDATGGLPQLVLFGLAVVALGLWGNRRA